MLKQSSHFHTTHQNNTYAPTHKHAPAPLARIAAAAAALLAVVASPAERLHHPTAGPLAAVPTGNIQRSNTGPAQTEAKLKVRNSPQCTFAINSQVKMSANS